MLVEKLRKIEVNSALFDKKRGYPYLFFLWMRTAVQQEM